ncbi:MAG: hypothetical protein R3E01_21005 [Pirellulaceae bacterium]|nr:hypothetical protein [Planctomycetales bacterium]
MAGWQTELGPDKISPEFLWSRIHLRILLIAGIRRGFVSCFTPWLTLAEDELQLSIAEPSHSWFFRRKTARHQRQLVRSFLELHHDRFIFTRYLLLRVDEISEDILGAGGRIPVANALAEIAAKATHHQSKRKIAIDFWCHGG